MGRMQNQAESSWRSRMTKFRRSKLTVVEFCRREAVSVPSFYHWRKQLEGGRGRTDAYVHGKSRWPHVNPISLFQ